MFEMNRFYVQATAMADTLRADRRALHGMPELGMELPRTTAYVEQRLRQMGLEPTRLGGGLTVCIGPRKGPVFLLRGDMDALKMQEASGLDFAATGECAHTCGHDLHTAMLLGAAALLKEREADLPGRVKLMFQPSEENLKGAAAMVEAGVLKNPPVDAAMALHVFPGPMYVGTLAWRQGPALASSDSFRILVRGKAGHGAIPQNAVDPLTIAAHILLALQEVNAREVDPQDPLVLTVCTIHGGELHNSIPETVEMKGSIRAFSNHNRAHARKRLVEICEGTAALFRGSCEVEFLAGVASLHNQPELAAELAGYAGRIAKKMEELPRQMGSEDFAEVSQQVPSVFMGIGAGGLRRQLAGRPRRITGAQSNRQGPPAVYFHGRGPLLYRKIKCGYRRRMASAAQTRPRVSRYTAQSSATTPAASPRQTASPASSPEVSRPSLK